MQWRYKNKIHNPVTNNYHDSQYLQVSIKLVLMKQTMAHQQQQTKYLQRQQAVSIMSRCCRIPLENFKDDFQDLCGLHQL